MFFSDFFFGFEDFRFIMTLAMAMIMIAFFGESYLLHLLDFVGDVERA